MIQTAFSPPFWLRDNMVQSLLASSRLRKFGLKALREGAEERIYRVPGGVRLQGFLNRPETPKPRGLVILIHGWEGKAESTYVVRSAISMLQAGTAVFRLNLRDHGETHHLNEGLFYATLLDEAHAAVCRAAEEFDFGFTLLAGFSLGGNFVLRMGLRCPEEPIPGLARIVAVSPAIDPVASTQAVDRNTPIRKYFIKKWRRSLRRKQRLFPETYDFGEALRQDSISAMTGILLRYSPYASPAAYFRGYTITEADFRRLIVPTTIIASEDDPVIPVADFLPLRAIPGLDLRIHPHGGHCGFVDSVFGPAWHDLLMLRMVDSLA